MLSPDQINEAVVYNKGRGYAPSCWRAIQKAASVPADGSPGPQTAQGIAGYQKSNGFTSDGKAGPTTVKHMGVTVKQASSDKYDVRNIVSAHPALTIGIDISDYQRTPDFENVADSGVRFVIIKATEGRTHTQKRYLKNAEAAKQAGLYVSYYHLGRLVHRGEETNAMGGAENFLRALAKLPPADFPVSLDLETRMIQDHIDIYKDRDRTLRWVCRFCERIERELGYKPMLYLSHRGAKLLKDDYGYLPELFSWWADYSSKTWGEEPRRAPGWNDWDIRQFTSGGKVPGIRGDCDLDYYDGDFVAFSKWMIDFSRGRDI